jgi:hypothetical protein
MDPCGSASHIHRALYRQIAIRSLVFCVALAAILGAALPDAWATPAATTTTLTVTSSGSAVTSVTSGTVITLTATVLSSSTPVSPGQVKFCDASAAHCEDAALLATAQLATAGVATYKFRPGPGSHSYQAIFVGTGTYAKSTSTTAALTVTFVEKYSTTTTIAASGSPGTYALAATVLGTGSRTVSPTGNVSFLDTTNGNASLGTAALGTAAAGEAFTAGSAPSVANPWALLVADFNGDGILDLGVESDSSSFNVLLGNADGTFRIKSSPSNGVVLGAVAVGDFNGDGIPDLVNVSTSTVTVLLGNGDGTFTTTFTTAVGGGNVVAGDFNGDGILDLAITYYAKNTVTILLGNGDGTFVKKFTSSANLYFPTYIVTADFNEDGMLDLAIADGNSTELAILLGNGDGTFTYKGAVFVAGYPGGTAVGDFNGDGIPDLVSTDRLGGNVTVLLGSGDGTFISKPSPTVGAGLGSIAVGDFNGDGILDAAVSTEINVIVLLGNGAGTFNQNLVPYSVTGYPISTTGIVSGDFNGDGIPDLAAILSNVQNGASPGAVPIFNEITETATARLAKVAVNGAEIHEVLARYPGDTNYDSSNSSTTNLLAAQVTTALKLNCTANPSAGNQVALTAILAPHSIDGFTTDGETVSFYDEGTKIATGTLSGGATSFTATSLLTGVNSLTASFGGDTNFTSANSNACVFTIPTITLASSTKPSTFGSPVKLTATLSPSTVGGSTLDGETVTFYSNGVSYGTGTLSSGVATLTTAYLPVGTDTLTATYAGDANFGSATSNAVTQTVNVAPGPPPALVVTVTTDDATGVAANCIGAPSTNCTLRDALAAAAAAGKGNISFANPLFATPQTITLAHGTLSIASNTTITGPTSSNAPLVTVSGGNQYTVFFVAIGVVNASISGFAITGGTDTAYAGGGISNLGVLTVNNCNLTGNSVAYTAGGGIYNTGTLTLNNSNVSGNSILERFEFLGGGGGVWNGGVMTIVGSSISGNTTSANSIGGAGILNIATLTIVNSIISGNAVPIGNPLSSAPIGAGILNGGNLILSTSTVAGNVNLMGNAGGIINGGTLTVTNSIVADNVATGPNYDAVNLPLHEDDCRGSGCPANGANGSVVGAGGSSLLPGSPAICAGLLADIPSGLTTDLRGTPRTTTYTTSSGSVTCVDSGVIQTHYSLNFSTQPPASVAQNLNFAAAVQLSENGSLYQAAGIPAQLALAAGDKGSLRGGAASTDNSGIATFPTVQVDTAGNGDALVGSVTVTTVPPPPSLKAPLSITATSSVFDVTASSNVQVSVNTAVPGLTFTVDGTPYTTSAAPVWLAGSQHTIATTSPQTISGQTYSFSSWSDGGSISHTVTAMAGASYTVNFTLGVHVVVNSASDDATGTPSNCTSASQSPCTLRDALAEATSAGGGQITFDPTVFAAAQPISARTITLTNGTLNVPASTTITGPTTGSGSTLTQLVTVNGNNQFTVFTTSGAGVVLSGLRIIGGNSTFTYPGGGGIYNGGGLMVVNGDISGNTGGGIFNNGGTLSVANSFISGNSGAVVGGGIENSQGTLTVTNSTVSGNSGVGIDNFIGTLTVIGSTISRNSGGGLSSGAPSMEIPVYATLTVANSTISGNTGTGIANYENDKLTVTNSIVAENTTNGSEDDGLGPSANGANGNIVGPNVQLVPLGNYGGPTPTMPPPPGSPAICAGLISNIPAGLTTDQRDLPRSTTYNGTPCVDSGAVQTNYTLGFSTEPPTIVAPDTNFAAAVQLSESGNPFPVSGITIPLTLGAGSTGSLSGGTAATGSTGTATYSSLQVNANGYGDTLVAMLHLTASGVTPAATASATSAVFDVLQPGSPVSQPIISPPTGTYTSAQSVTITDTTPGATIYYTTDGSNPNRSSAVFSGTPITVNSSQTIKALAVAPSYAASPEGVAIYNIIPPYAAAPTFNLPPGFYHTAQMVGLSDVTPGARIYYTTDHSVPTTSSTLYTGGSIAINITTQLKAIAVAPGYSTSTIAVGDFYVSAAQPLISPPSGTYTSAQSVTITDTTPGAVIYYTTDGTNPNRSSAVFSGTPITVNSSQTIKALAVAPSYAASPEGVAIYKIIPPYAAAPTFNLPPGFYHTAQMVGLSDVTPGARIYYTTDHSVPTTSSTLYTGGSIAINITTQLKAIAVAPGYSTSPIAVGDYYVSAAQPIISPPTGRYSGAQAVTITSATPGATIYYTTDGSNPNWHSPVFNPASPITVTSSQVVKALAWAPGYTTSPEGVAAYTIAP